MSAKIYVEGGGDNDDTITRCRRAFALYCANAAPQGRRPRIVPCGGRDQTFDKFKASVQNCDAGDVCALLVDAEGPVEANTPIAHLSARDRWKFPQLRNHQVFLMVQAMEGWFLADRGALAEFYDGKFRAKGLPGSPTNIEAIAKDDLAPKLKHASKRTRKGEYHKVQHGFALLALVDPAKVERASPHAARFHEFLRGL